MFNFFGSKSDRDNYRVMQEGLREGRLQNQDGPIPYRVAPAADGVAAAVQATRRLGPGSNAGVIGALIGRGGASQCYLGNLDMDPFTDQAMNNNELTVEGMVTAACLISMRITSPDERRQAIIYETMVPCVPLQNIMPQAAASAELELLLDNALQMRGQSWWVAYITGHANTPWDMATGVWVGGTTLADKLQHVHVATTRHAPPARDCVMYTDLLAIISFALRGDVSNTKLARIQTDLRTTMPFVSNLSREDIMRTWANYGHLVDENNAGPVIAHWMACLPGGCIRLRVCLAQAAVGLNDFKKKLKLQFFR